MGNRSSIAYYFYIGGLAILIASLPLSKFTMSISQMMLGVAWLLMGDYRTRIHSFFRNKVALAIASIYLMHLIGLIYTSDFTYAIKDLRVKFPLLVIPFMFATFPKLKKEETRALIYIFTAATTVATGISFFRFITNSVEDYRDLSPFISHIRFSLLVCLAAFLIFYQAWNESNKTIKFGSFLLAVWLTYMLFVLQSATSLIIFFATAFIIVFYLGFIRVKWIIQVIALVAIAGPALFGLYYIFATFNNFTKIPEYDIHKLEKYTSSGNRYKHDTTSYWIENGRHGGLYQCEIELKREWNKWSQIKFDSLDANGQIIRYTLIRYLTSLDLRKDSAGVAALSNDDIKNIEEGIANHDYLTDNRLKTAVNQVALGYYQYIWKKDTRGSSLMQRIELWKTSIQLIEKNPWFGTGTGDLPNDFANQLRQNKSGLAGLGLRSHNQFLSITTALGIFGLVWFVSVLVFIIVYRKRWLDFRVLISYCIIVFSMFNEDTIETQAGVTFFCFFLSFFLILNSDNNDGNLKNQTDRNYSKLTT